MRRLTRAFIFIPVVTALLYVQLAPEIELTYCNNQPTAGTAADFGSLDAAKIPGPILALVSAFCSVGPVLPVQESAPPLSATDVFSVTLVRSHPGRAPPAN